MNDLYFTPIEVSRLVGIDQRRIQETRRDGLIESRLGVRRGRRNVFAETLYRFDEVLKLCPEFEYDHEKRIYSMFQLRSGPFAFRVIEACRLADVSKQYVYRLIAEGEIKKMMGLRLLKTTPENLIRLSELVKLFNGRIGKSINIEDEILNLFRLAE